MGGVGRLLLAVLLISASACTVQGKVTRYWAQFHHRRTSTTFTLVFRPLASEPVKNKGWGWTLHSDILQTSGGSPVGYVGGMEYFHSTDAAEEVITVTFSPILEGIWKGSSLNIRGPWRTDANGGSALAEQELAIVGGQGGLRGASGTVYYKWLPADQTYRVTCDIYVDDFMGLMPKTYVDFDSMYKSGTELVRDSPETTDNVLKQVGGSPVKLSGPLSDLDIDGEDPPAVAAIDDAQQVDESSR